MQLPETYDEQAVAWIAALEQRLARRLPPERFGPFAAMLGALEYQVEVGIGHPPVIRHLGDAILALAAHQSLPPAVVKDITQTLGRLHSHAVALAHAHA